MIRCALILLTAAVLHAQQPVEGTGAPAAAGKRLSVNSSYLLGWSSVISQDIILPLRRKPLSQDSQVVLNRVVNVFVSLFVLFWGVWYVLPGPVYFYLNITATPFLAGAFSAFIGGLFWSRASVFGAYYALTGGAVGSMAYFFKIPVAYAGMSAFGLAAAGMILGSLLVAPDCYQEEFVDPDYANPEKCFKVSVPLRQ
jgi:SSS family solute:Na+ symporter